MPPSLALVVLVYAAGATTHEPAKGPALHARVVAQLEKSGATVVSQAVETAIADRRAGWRALDELSFFARGHAAFERGRRARERVELDEAVRALAEAEMAYGGALAEPGGASLVAETALEQGVALAELGRVDEARTEFRRALALQPDLGLTERIARPDVVRLFRDTARVVARNPVARQALVGGAPMRATDQLRVDGKIVTDVSLAAGFHLFVVERDGARAAVLVDLPAEPSTIDLPEPIDPLIERIVGLRTAPLVAGLSALQEALGIDEAIVVVASADGRHALVQRAGLRCLTSAVDIAIEDDAALAKGLSALRNTECRGAAIVALEDPRLLPPPILAPSAAATLVARKPHRARSWPWIFAGALAVTAAVVGVTVAVVVSDPRYTLQVNGRDFGAK